MTAQKIKLGRETATKPVIAPKKVKTQSVREPMSPEKVIVRFHARRVVELATAEEYVDWAIAALELGQESPSLAVLAGLPTTYFHDIRVYFERAAAELGIQVSQADPRILRQYLHDTA